jgi:pyrroloquinoline quinone biosynthesis protein B
MMSPMATAIHGRPHVIVLGIAQDGGRPQAGCRRQCCAAGQPERHPACLAIVDPRAGHRWLIDATPALPAQLRMLDETTGITERVIDGVFLTHAHIGHYTGLIHLGREAMAVEHVPVWCGDRLRQMIAAHDPWRRLIEHGHVTVHPDDTVHLADDITVRALPVPHRDEISDTVGYMISGPTRSVLWLPDIDSWEAWDQVGTHLEDILDTVDIAWIDATFWDDDELERDMSLIPHPRARATLERLSSSRPDLLDRVRFVHLNHTNPLLDPMSSQTHTTEAAGARVSAQGDAEAI